MTLSEENYLKALYHLEQHTENAVSTNALAEEMQTKASSATDMVKKLAEKQLLSHTPYQGAKLSEAGKSHAIKVIRKHRLWETFLVDKLNFNWDEVHDVAEQLEHIESEKLIDELDAFLKFPKYDPHGDPIPDKNGTFNTIEKITLAEASVNKSYKCVGVKDDSSQFLKYLDSNKISLGSRFEILYKEPFDDSVKINIDGKEMVVSNNVAKNLYLKSV